MIGMKLSDPNAIVMEYLSGYVEKQLRSSVVPKAAESLGHYMLGVKTSRLYRRDISEPVRNIMAREYLRGIIADFRVG